MHSDIKKKVSFYAAGSNSNWDTRISPLDATIKLPNRITLTRYNRLFNQTLSRLRTHPLANLSSFEVQK